MLVQCRPGLTQRERSNCLRVGFSTSRSVGLRVHLPELNGRTPRGSVTAASEDPMHFSAKPLELTKTK